MNALAQTNAAPNRASADSLARLRREHLVYEVDGLLYTTALADFDAVAEASFQPESDPSLPALRGMFEDARGSGPVLSLHQILDPQLTSATSAKAIEHRLIIFSRGESRFALQVHRCLGVFPIKSTAQLSLLRSSLLREQNSGCRSVLKWNGQLIVALDPSVLISPDLESALRDSLGRLEALKEKSRGRRQSAEATAKESVKSNGAIALQGALAGGMLSQVLQIVWLRRLSGELVLESKDGTYTLYCAEGEVIHARNGAAMPPDQALRKALRTRTGNYQFRSSRLSDVARTLKAATPQLIREAATAFTSNRQA